MDLDQIKQSIRESIVENLRNGIEQFLGILNENSSLFNETTNLLGRLVNLEKEIRQGVISIREAEIKRNKIRVALLDSLDEIKELNLSNTQDRTSEHIDTGTTGLLSSMIVPSSLLLERSIQNQHFCDCC